LPEPSAFHSLSSSSRTAWEELRKLMRRRAGGRAKRREQSIKSGNLNRTRAMIFSLRNTFEELAKFMRQRTRLRHGRAAPGSGTASSPVLGELTGALCMSFAQDFTVFGGSCRNTNALKICVKLWIMLCAFWLRRSSD